MSKNQLVNKGEELKVLIKDFKSGLWPESSHKEFCENFFKFLEDPKQV